MPSVGDRLTAARHRQFVGRTHELELLQSALTASELPFHVLFIHGPGGVGKTSLLHEYALVCAAAEAQTYFLDARNFEPTPESFMAALRATLNLPDDQSLLHTLVEWEALQVFLIDTSEVLVPLGAWLHDVCLPQLPENDRLTACLSGKLCVWAFRSPARSWPLRRKTTMCRKRSR